MISRPFHFPSWLLLLQVLMQVIFQWTIGSKRLRHTAYNCLLPQSATSRKKNVCTKKVYEINDAETSLWISSISFVISFNKVGKFLCFRRKATSQGLIKKMCLGVSR